MKEIDLIKKMALSTRAKRSDILIAPIKLDCLDTQNWVFPLCYGFREALDIRYTEKVTTIKKMIDGQEVKVKKKYMIWTQGRIIAFKDGDLIINTCGDIAVQVEFAQPMGWDVSKDTMYTGSVMFKLYNIQEGKYLLAARYKCDQLEFLTLLINGSLQGINEIAF